MKNSLSIILILCFISCVTDNPTAKMKTYTEDLPNKTPLQFMKFLTPPDKLIHKGVVNPEFTEYYYTISDKQFKQFDVYVIKKKENVWSKPEKAFFNSKFSDHGMSFSPDGKSIYFSSTRPVRTEGISETWHIWKCDNINGKWNEPKFVDIPNLRNKLLSHPIITKSGKLYFHSSNLDYSEMNIYQTYNVNGGFAPATKTSISGNEQFNQICTPYVSPKEEYILFASIGKQLELLIAYNDGNDNWINSRKLSDIINHNGQGNPSVTADDKFLFYTTGNSDGTEWKVNWVNIENEIKK